jgi:ankyrin repeat protein
VTKDTPLALAAYFGHDEAVALLLSRGASWDAADVDGCVPGDTFDSKVDAVARQQVRELLADKRGHGWQ